MPGLDASGVQVCVSPMIRDFVMSSVTVFTVYVESMYSRVSIRRPRAVNVPKIYFLYLMLHSF